MIAKYATVILPLLASLAAAGSHPLVARAALVGRQSSSCPIGEATCGARCMPLGSNCCNSDGAYCKGFEYCDNHGGCCPIGETCIGPGGTSTISEGNTMTNAPTNVPPPPPATPTEPAPTQSEPSPSSPTSSTPAVPTQTSGSAPPPPPPASSSNPAGPEPSSPPQQPSGSASASPPVISNAANSPNGGGLGQIVAGVGLAMGFLGAI